MKRRTALSRIGAPLLAGLAGCLNGAPGSEGTETGATPGTESPGTTARLEVLERSCGEGTNSATVAFDAESVRIDGTIGGSDTCDTAALDTVEVSDGTLTVAVATVQETVTGTPVCGQCLTDIDYQVTVANAGGVDAVVVRHDGDQVVREERP